MKAINGSDIETYEEIIASAAAEWMTQVSFVPTEGGDKGEEAPLPFYAEAEQRASQGSPKSPPQKSPRSPKKPAGTTPRAKRRRAAAPPS